MIVRYGDVQFYFEQTDADTLAGYLKIDEEQEKLLATLVASEKEDWCLDKSGERLPPDELFSLSPWSIETSSGSVKLLNRVLNIKTGEALFSTQDTYGGEFFTSHLRGGQ